MKNCSFCNLTKDDEKWLLLETKYWKLYLSDNQDYIGRCIVISKRHCDNLSNLDNDEWFDLKNIINITEKMCKDVFSADLCNWSCLMNDAYKENPPIAHLHIHIRPRHKKTFRFGGCDIADEEFGHHYDNHKRSVVTDTQMCELYALCRKWIIDNSK